MALVDHLSGLVRIVEADSGVSALVSDRVWGVEVDAGDAGAMPQKSVVLRDAGGPGGLGTQDHSDLVEVRVDVLCYGEIPFEAARVWRAVYPVFKSMNRVLDGNLFVYRALHSGGPINARDRDTDWPFILGSFDVLFAADEVS